MQTEDEMSVNERRMYLTRMKERYVRAKRAEQISGNPKVGREQESEHIGLL